MARVRVKVGLRTNPNPKQVGAIVGEMAEPYRSVGVGLAAAAGAALLLALGTLW